MDTHKKKFQILFSLLLIMFLHSRCSTNSKQEHECRFWGIIFSGEPHYLNTLIRTHLESLGKLGAYNPNGWGLGYFVESENDTILPVIQRGGPPALYDPRYPVATQELIRNVTNSAVAHVRKGSSGPIGGIPDPHPFRRQCINRKFDMLFAHNGTINTDILLRLISLINPSYLEQNPPDYEPNYLDSDLYAILLVEIMDLYPDLTIQECIKTAIIKLDSALGNGNAQLNFVMTDGYTLWALNFTKNEPRAITVYYYPDSLVSNFWVVASQPLDTLTHLWVEIPNLHLAMLRPNEPVQLISIANKNSLEGKKVFSKNFFITPNPFNRSVSINYYLPSSSFVNIDIYDGAGRHIRKLYSEFQNPGEYKISWDGCDDDHILLPNGTYFCHIQSENEFRVLKVILMN